MIGVLAVALAAAAGAAPNPSAAHAAPAPARSAAPSPLGSASLQMARRPVVWIQAGHAAPREPGYRDQSGTGGGPFGAEIGFTTRLAARVAAKLRAAGVDARITPGLVTPWGAGGATFVSLHHDSPGGAAAVGHAIAGAGENYYHGEGSGTPSSRPYADSAPHRDATRVSGSVERRSRALARRIARRLGAVHTSANGAEARFGGVQTREGNPRMMRYYGFYRVRTGARVIVEAGAAGADDRFLARTNLIARVVSRGVVEDLRARGLLR